MLLERMGRRRGISLWLAAALAFAATGAWAQEETFFYNWTLELQASRPYAQGGISWGNSLQERVIPPRKAVFDESIQYRLAAGRYFQFNRESSRAWHLSVSGEYYKGAVDKYGVLVDRNGSLYAGSSFFAQWPLSAPLPAPTADGDEGHSVFGLGELTRTPLSLSLTREFRLRKGLRPFVGLTAGYVRTDWTDEDPSHTLALLNPQFVDPNNEDCGTNDIYFVFGLCQTSGSDPDTTAVFDAIHAIVSALPFPYTGSCIAGKSCVIPPPTISTEMEDGLEYGMFMGVNLHFGKKQRWAFNTQARYMWSQAPLRVSLSHPLQGINTCLAEDQRNPTIPPSLTMDCLTMITEEEAWIKVTNFDPLTGDQEFHFWQFKGGEISQNRWELFMGVRYLFGRRK